MTHIEHLWQFARIGGVNRVSLETAKDLINLKYLDKKLWTALSCPVQGLEIDSKTLEYIDKDKDGRIRTPEILEAVEWMLSVIKNPDDLLLRSSVMPLNAIDRSSEEGSVLWASAKQILVNLNKENYESLTVEDTSDSLKIFAHTRFNGDGIITEDTTDDEALKKLIASIVSCMGYAMDRSGKEGISVDILEAFYNECLAFEQWQTKADAHKELIFPFGTDTPEAYNLFNQLKTKVEDYFVRCRLACFDPVSVTALSNIVNSFEAIKQHDLNEHMQEIASMPLAIIGQHKPLPLTEALNPAWEKTIKRFSELVIKPMFKQKESITEDAWQEVCTKFDAYAQWVSEKAGTRIEPLGLEYIKLILNNGSKDALHLLINEDLKLTQEAENIFKVDKLVRYYKDLFRLLNNFVSFHDFYDRDSKAIFQAGRLFIDQRSCDLCIKVSDMAKHATMAGLSGICLVYCECTSKVKNEKMIVVAAFTDGDFDDIMVGRNAIFFDNNGLDWDATIIKVLENPISIRQAFWSPYRKFSKFISKQIEKFASAREEKVTSTATAGIEKTAAKADEGLSKSVSAEAPAATTAAAPATPQPFDIGKFVGIFAAIGLAIGAIGSVLAAILSGFLSLVWWKMPLAFLGVILAISGPSMILAWLKLRKRNLAPVLDANGWAINAKATINIIFGKTLTQLALLPTNARLNRIDPFKKKKNALWYIVPLALLLSAAVLFFLWHYGYIKNWGFFNN